MNQLTYKDLELAKKHALHVDYHMQEYGPEVVIRVLTYSPEGLAALFAERDAEQQPNAGDVCSRCNGSGEQLYLVGGGPDANDELGPCSECNGTGTREDTEEAAVELREVYEAARQFLRYNGVDRDRVNQAVDRLDQAIEAVKHIDAGYKDFPLEYPAQETKL